MTPNSENTMARFLLAILNQKNLKDIDWNQVASDPVLLQPITNGHAARMRFARFRTAVNGHEPKRNRTADKSRVTKTRKVSGSKRDSLVKSEAGGSPSSFAQVRQSHSPQIKQEQNQHGYLVQFSPASTTSPYLTDNREDINPRFLTPCSDDMANGLAVNPASLEDLRLRNGFGPSIDCNQDLMNPPLHDHLGLAQSPFHTFDAAYDLSNYKVPGDSQSPVALDLTGGPSFADFSPEWTTDNFHDHHPF